MNVVIRTDASVRIGSGHVMRCITLGEELRNSGMHIDFICRDHPGHMIEFIRNKGFHVFVLTDNLSEASSIKSFLNDWHGTGLHLDWFVVDHYDWDVTLEKSIRSDARKIMVIDDLANRMHDCDLLLDQNLVQGFLERYSDLVPAHCERFLGPQYAIIRQEFVDAGQNVRHRDGRIGRLLVFFSGSDPTNETEKALEALLGSEFKFQHIDVIVGASNPNKSRIAGLCRGKARFQFHCQIDHMAELMSLADLSLGAGGTTAWERCTIGLPAVLIGIAQNQMETIDYLHKIGAVLSLGWHEDVRPEHIIEALSAFVNSKHLLQKTSLASKSVVGIRTSPCENIVSTMWKIGGN